MLYRSIFLSISFLFCFYVYYIIIIYIVLVFAFFFFLFLFIHSVLLVPVAFLLARKRRGKGFLHIRCRSLLPESDLLLLAIWITRRTGCKTAFRISDIFYFIHLLFAFVYIYVYMHVYCFIINIDIYISDCVQMFLCSCQYLSRNI